MADINVTENNALFTGLSQLGWDMNKITSSSDKAKNKQWKRAFVPSASICTSVFNLLRQNNQKLDFVSFLMNMFWLSNYPVMPSSVKSGRFQRKHAQQRSNRT